MEVDLRAGMHVWMMCKQPCAAEMIQMALARDEADRGLLRPIGSLTTSVLRVSLDRLLGQIGLKLKLDLLLLEPKYFL